MVKQVMTSSPASAVLFAYHNVGVRSLLVLLEQGIHIPLVVTHRDDPQENRWFDSVAEVATLAGIETLTPEDPNTPELIHRIQACRPDFVFSFYYRKMLGKEILASAGRGAYNLHGSLLPRYRGRVPINWAVLHGERETGVTLHQMVLKPDAGAIVAQEPVTILSNDTAHAVFQKAVCAGERLLTRTLPLLLDGTAPHTAMDVSQGSYFGGRKPEDGDIDWRWPALKIHNLVRAVAPPYPGAFFDVGKHRMGVLGSHYRHERVRSSKKLPRLYWEHGDWYVDCLDGRRTLLRPLTVEDQPLDPEGLLRLFGATEIPLLTEKQAWPKQHSRPKESNKTRKGR